MSEKGLTTIALKKINRSKIYQYIYRSKLTSKLQIVQDLQMGLSTVSQNLNLLENEGLIEKNGYFDSTGGRKANAIQIVSDFRISIGVGILKNMFHITAIDLYGNTVYTDTIPLTYSNTAAYYQQITDKVKDFIEKIENQAYRHETILADKEEDVLQNVDQAVFPLIDKMVDAISKEELAEMELVIGDGEDRISIMLETGIINLPFENIKRVDNFFDDLEAEVPVIVYFIAKGRLLNESDFKIMRVSPASEFIKDHGQKTVALAASDALNRILANRESAKEE